MKKYIVEFIGTFFLVFTVGVTAGGGDVLRALAIGSALAVMVYAGGHVSGGHYNPAVTLGVWLRGKLETREVLPYWISQFAAALVAAVAVGVVSMKCGAECSGILAKFGAGANFAVLPSIVAEFIGTFALVWVVLNVATAKGTEGNSFYGLAIGFTVFVSAVAVGGISGGAFNPAVGLGVLSLGLAGVQQFVVYVVADLVGGLAAALTFKAVNGKE